MVDLRRFVSIGFYLLILFAITEGTLRIQQQFGPLYDLEFSEYDLGLLSDQLNHKPHPRKGYDENGVMINPHRPNAYPDEMKPYRVLFMGDSFMHGWPHHHTIPQIAWKYLQTTDFKDKPVLFFNAGYSSYAPPIYTPQAKILIPIYQPDYLVISIDETDLIDSYASYRPLIKRDDQGKIVGVMRSPAYSEKVKGYVKLRKQPLYLMRLAGVLFHKGIRMPYVAKIHQRKHKEKYYAHPLADSSRRYSYNLVTSFDQDPDAQKYASEKAYFEESLHELFQTLIDQMGDPSKILILYHPHLHQLIADDRGVVWQAHVAEAIERVVTQYDLAFYNVTEDLKSAFGLRPEDFYFEGDMHFNHEGFKVYGELVGKKLKEVM